MRPNILLFFPDQLRPDWVGPANIGGAITPAIDRLMAHGTTFRNAICPSPICAPSRACLATGYEFDRSSVPDNRYSVGLDEPNFYRQLAAAGYAVLTCGKADLLKGDFGWGQDGQHDDNGQSRLKALGFTGGLDSGGKHAVIVAHDRGKAEPYLHFLQERGLASAHVEDFAARTKKPGDAAPGATYLNTDPTPLPDDAYQDGWIGRCGHDLIENACDQTAPWFLQVNFAGPHEPMDITRTMAASVADRRPPMPAMWNGEDAAVHTAIRRCYTAMVENIDRILGTYVDLLESKNQLDNTIIIFASDHGEMLGDCGLWEKSLPHQKSIGVPLIFMGPGIEKARASDGPASIIDLHATILELAEADVLAGVDSRSMCATLADASIRYRDIVFSGLGKWRIAFDGRYKLVSGYVHAESRNQFEDPAIDPKTLSHARLIDTHNDQCETSDVSALYPAIAARLLGALKHNIMRS
ncbi:sulfatase-like hydrolase/transferase [Devosia algicola]|uniref:Sulfatase-like hydrolase/transferase n=1 Tax=Devosia algicola TaxID=3026418 RepID=A0ABY7YQS7_9HYPH|nr:sulfatase-like hydrolase/transferase [Devosia algicola]WDR03552.1 sulfatase-like hydrolase/transferase [Devosia algicola]